MNSFQDPLKRYRTWMLAFTVIYVAFNIAAIFGLFDRVHGPASWLLALATSIPLIGQVWITLLLMRDSDEFVRALAAKRFIVAAGITLSLYSSWGFLEIYSGAKHAPNFLIFAVFWAAFGIVAPFIQSTRS